MKFNRRLALCAPIFFAASSLAHAVDATWTGATNTTWDTTSTNWSGAGLPANPWDSTNGATDKAIFNGATVGTITLGASGVFANALQFDTTGYTISGSTLNLAGTSPTITTATGVTATISSTVTGAAATGTTGLFKDGLGTLILSGTKSYTGNTVINAGTLRLDGSVIGAAATQTVSGTGTLVLGTYNGLFIWGSGNATVGSGFTGLIDVQTAYSLTGPKGFFISANSNFANNLGDMNIASGAGMWLNGSTVQVDALTGSGTINANSGTATLRVGANNGTGTFSGSITNSGSTLHLSKIGTGTQILNNTNNYTGDTGVGAGTLEIASGGSISGAQLNVGTASGSTGTLTLSGGTVTAGSHFAVSTASTTATGIVNVNSGTLNIGASTATQTYVGVGGTGTLNIAGGTANVGVGSNSDPYRSLWIGVNGTGTANLNSGTLSTARDIAHYGTGTGTFNFNGGTLKLASGYSSFAGGLLSATSHASGAALVVNVKAGGALIDTNGQNATITTSLAHDAGLGATRDGGLTKLGAGNLILTAANTYTGNTVVNAGALNLADNASLKFLIGASGVNNAISGAGTLTLDGDFVLDLTTAAAAGSWLLVNNSTLTETYSSTFTVAGFTENNNLWTKTANGATYTFDEATGILTAVPEPAAALLGGLGVLALLRRRRA